MRWKPLAMVLKSYQLPYEAAGFTAFGVERGFMLLDGRLHDEIHMVRTVETAATK